ncbi:uncharacterized protein TNCV_1537601 [Trichonephila clavipes]|nr:uncharacterized protein TNCV_1537601 [Trichonephila clavipes]
MNSVLLSEWYSKVFIPNVNKLRVCEGKTGKVLLTLDNAPCHPPIEILNAIGDDFDVMYLLPNVTVLVQPMDQGVIEKLKTICSKQVLWRLLLSENDKIPGFQECDEEDVETWMACDADDCGFQTLNDDEMVTSVQAESDPVDDETDEDEDINNENSKVHQMLTHFLR